MRRHTDCFSTVRTTRRGISLIEVCVVITTLSAMMALMLPAVVKARETARSMDCENRLRQIGCAIHQYEATWNSLPSGLSTATLLSTHARILPFLDEQKLHERVNPTQRDVFQTKALRSASPVVFQCPDAGDLFEIGSGTNYIMNSGGGVPGVENGLIVGTIETGKRMTLESICDGISNTVLVAEAGANGTRKDGSKRIPKNWQTAIAKSSRWFQLPEQAAEFQDHCRSLSYGLADFSGPVNEYQVGSSWLFGAIGVTRIVSSAAQLELNCSNSGTLQLGVYAPSSSHAGFFNSVMGDGSVRSHSTEMHNAIWIDLCDRDGKGNGPRDGDEAAF